MENNPPNISPEVFESVQRYLNGTMAIDQRKVFETRLNGEPSFARQVNEAKAVIIGIEASALKNDLDNFHDEMAGSNIAATQKTKVKPLFFQKYAMAASIALLLGIAAFWFLNRDESNDQLFDKHFKADPGLATTMSDDQAYNFYEGMVSYKHGDYEIAIELWEQELISKPQNDSINYFLGVAHLANLDATKAIPYLTKVTKINKSEFQEDSFYYLGLAYLKNNDTENAIKYLSLNKEQKSQKVLPEIK